MGAERYVARCALCGTAYTVRAWYWLESLGIERFEWERGPNGYVLGFAGLRMRTADMARIGQLMLQRAG